MPYTTIDKPTDYFNTVLWSGNSSTQSITGVGFQANFVWIKDRSGGNDNQILDSVRGATKALSSNRTDLNTFSDGLTSFDSDGYSLGNNTRYNASGSNYVGWNWLAGGTASSNSDGSTTSTVSANTTSGFSIVKFTGTGSATTLGHGLGAVPKWILVKTLDRTENWVVYHVGNDASAPEDKSIRLDGTNAVQDNSGHFNDTAPTSSVFSVGNGAGVNPSGEDQIAYCFAEKKGYSKFGSYTGNGNEDGIFVYTGFLPAWVMIKRSSASGNNWVIYDNKRDVGNVVHHRLHADVSNAEVNTSSSTVNNMDFLSNGIKIRNSGGAWNNSGDTYIYMCFAEAPFVTSTGIPTTAR